MFDSRNLAPLERGLSVVTGGLLWLLALRRRDSASVAAGVTGGLMLYRGITGFCPIYSSLGIGRGAPYNQRNDAASVPYGTGVRVEKSVLIARPAAELYAFWRRLETLPQFMQHLEEVTALTDRRSRWRVRAAAGSRVTWEAEIINDLPGRLIGWRSLPGSAVHHAGSVHFEERDGMTEVRVLLEYAPLARYLGASIARLLGEDPLRQIGEDLHRFKTIVERGEHANLQ